MELKNYQDVQKKMTEQKGTEASGTVRRVSYRDVQKKMAENKTAVPKSEAEHKKLLGEQIAKGMKEKRKERLYNTVGFDTLNDDLKAFSDETDALSKRVQDGEFVTQDEIAKHREKGKALQTRAGAYLDLVSDFDAENKDGIASAESVKTGLSDVDSWLEGVGTMFGKFSGAEEYQTAFDNEAYGAKYKDFSYEDVQKAIETTSGREKDWLTANADSFMSSADAQAEIDQINSEIDATEKEYGFDEPLLAQAFKYGGTELFDLFAGGDATGRRAAKDEIEGLKTRKAELEALRDLSEMESWRSNEDFKKNSGFDKSQKKSAAFGNFADAVYTLTDDDASSWDVTTISRNAYGFKSPIDTQSAMTADQKNLFRYIYNTKGSKEAGRYLDLIADEVNQEAGRQLAAEIRNMPAVPEALVGGLLSLKSGAENFATGATNAILSPLGEAVPTTSTQYAAGDYSGGLNRVGRIFFQGGQAVGNMLPAILIGNVAGALGASSAAAGNISIAATGISSGGNAYKQALDEGYSASEARAFGVLTGASEAALGKVLGGVGKYSGLGEKALIQKAGQIGSKLGRLPLIGAIKVGSEVAEEEIQAFLEPAFKSIVMGETYDAPAVDELIDTMLVTMISTGVLEGDSIVAEARLPSATAESFKAKYDTEGNLGSFLSNLYADDTVISAKVIQLVEEGKTADAVKQLNEGIRNYRYAKEYAQQVYGKSADVDGRIGSLENLKTRIKDGSFNAEAAKTALRKSSDVWQAAAENNDAVASLLLDPEVTNSKIEKKAIKNRATIRAFKRVTGIDLDGLETVSKKRETVRDVAKGYGEFVSSEEYKEFSALAKANETEPSATKRTENTHRMVELMISLHNRYQTEAETATGERASVAKAVAGLADAANAKTRNHDLLAFATKADTAPKAKGQVDGATSEGEVSSGADTESADRGVFLRDLAEEHLSGLDGDLRSDLEGAESVSELRQAETDVIQRLTERGAEKADVDRVKAFATAAATRFVDLSVTTEATARNAVENRARFLKKALKKYGIDVKTVSGGIHFYAVDGNNRVEITAKEANERRIRGERTTMQMVRGSQSGRTVEIAREIASGTVTVMDPLTGELMQLRVGRDISAERAVDVIIAHEAVHYAKRCGDKELVRHILDQIAGTRLDSQYEIANRRAGRPVSAAARANWERMRSTYVSFEMKESKLSREAAEATVNDDYLYEEIACDYMGCVAAYIDLAQMLAAKKPRFFRRVVNAFQRLFRGLDKDGAKAQAKAARDLAERFERIAEKTYGSQKKVASQSAASQEAAEATETAEKAEEGENLDEEVPDSANKRLIIKSAYKKSSSDQVLNMESKDSPQPTPKASLGYTAFNDSISRNDGGVNRKFSVFPETEGTAEEGENLEGDIPVYEAGEGEVVSTPAAEKVARYSVSYEGEVTELSLDDVSSLKTQLKEHLDEVNALDPVDTITYSPVNKKALKERAVSEFKKFGYVVDRQGFGKIEIGEKQIANGLNYLNNEAEKAALLAVPKVLKRGVEISGHGNHKGRRYATVTIAAPVSINGKVGNVVVAVRKTGNNRYYTHRILLPNGSEFVFEENKNAELTSADMPAHKNEERPAIGSASENSISHPKENVNRKFSVSSEMDAEYMSAVESGDVEAAQRMVDEAARAAGYSNRMYHGAKKSGGFTVFRDWGYFTENRAYAERYAERDKEGSLYEVYVKMEAPFDTRDAEAKAIFEKEIRPVYGDSELQTSGLPDWTDGYDICDFIEENDLPYDSVILDEGGDMANGKPVSRGESYVIKDSSQIKSAAPVTYDDNGNVIPLSERFNEKKSDIRWSVAGENSYDADLSALDEAILRIQNGDDRNAVIRDTGWWMGKDGKWRYEISDKDMEFDPNGFYDNPQTLGDYVKHDNLFRAYPFLRDIKVIFANVVSNDPTALGEYDMEENTITMKEGLTADDVKKTFLHELQHAVQRYENFIEGSSWDAAAVGLFNMAYKTIKDSEQYKRLKTPNERLNFVKRYTIKRGNPSFAKQAFSLYFENYGEVEARVAENRLKMTEEERRLNPIENDGFVYSVRKIKSGFIDNLRSMGYNEGQINNFLEKGIFHGNQSRNVSESLREDGQHGGVEGSAERSSGAAMRGGEGSRVSRPGDLQTGERGKTDGNLREDSIKYSVSDETEVDDGALSYEELEKEVASLREKNRALIQELHLSHGKVLDGKAVRAHLKDVIDSFGGTAKVQEIENEFSDLYEYLYNEKRVVRDGKGNFLRLEKVSEVEPSVCEAMLNRMADKIFVSAVDVDDTYAEYTSLLKELHDTKLTVSEQDKGDFDDVGGWAEFRKKNFGRLSLVKEGGLAVDSYYMELCDRFPELFSDDITHPADQLKEVASVAKTIREAGLEPKNVFSGLDEEAILAEISLRILDGFALERHQTFADKAQQRVKDARLGEMMHYGKKIAELKRKYENRVKTVTEKFETKIADRSEAQQARYQKKMVGKRGKELARRLAKPTKTAHIPFDFEGDVFGLLKKINWASATAADREVEGTVNALLEGFAKRNEDKAETDFGFSEGLRGDVKAFFEETKPMDVMNSSELHKLNELLRRAIYEVNQADKVFHSGESAAVASLKARQQFHTFRKDLKERGPIRRRLDWALDFASDAEGFFTVLNVPELTEAYQNLAACQDKLARNVRMLSDEMKRIVGEKGIPRAWRETTTEYTFSSGRSIRCTPAQLMTVYLYAKQEDSRKCLVNEYGGAAFTATEKKFRVTDKNGNVIETNSLAKLKDLKNARHIEAGKRVVGGETVLTDGDLDMIRDTLLTDEQRAMADTISEFLNTKVTDMANETSLEVEGYRKFFIENYFPMSVFDKNVSIETILQNEHMGIMNASFTKERSGLARKKLLVDDVFSVMNRHLVSVAHYNAYKKALVDFQKIYTIRPNGESSLQNDIISSFGVGKKNSITAFIDRFLTNVQGVQMATDEETLLSEKFLGRYKAAQVAANLSVVAKQPTALLRAMPEFSPKGIAAMHNVKTTKTDVKEMVEHSGLAAYKSWGYSEYSTGSTFEELYNENARSLRDKFDDVMSWGAQKADELTWAAIWRAAKADTDTLEEATAKFNEVIRKTQVVDSAFTSSLITKQNGLSKLAFAFKNEPLKTVNYIRSSAHDAALGKQGAKKKLALVLATSAINTAVVSAITAAFSMLRSEEEEEAEEFLSKWTEAMLEDFFGNLTLLGGDIVNALQGESVERMDLAAFTDAYDAVSGLIKFFRTPKNEQKKTFLSLLYDTSRAASNLTGIPIGNLLRFGKTFAWSVADAVDSPPFDYTLTSLFYNVEGIDNTEVKRRFRSILTDALDQGKYGAFETIRQDLRSKGFAASEVEKAIASSERLYDAWCEGPAAMNKELTKAENHTKVLTLETVTSAFNSRKTELVNTLYDATKVGDKKAVHKAKEALLNHRDVKTYQKLREYEIEELLEAKYRKQLETEVKNRLVDLYQTEAYEGVKGLILKEYKNFGVTSDEIDRIVRNLQ